LLTLGFLSDTLAVLGFASSRVILFLVIALFRIGIFFGWADGSALRVRIS
jgi:hypothetical protein